MSLASDSLHVVPQFIFAWHEWCALGIVLVFVLFLVRFDYI